MTIDFISVAEQAAEGFKGGEGTVYLRAWVSDSNRIMRVHMPVGSSIGMHVHTTNSETIFVLRGEACITNGDGTVEYVKPGQAHHCPKGSGHSTANRGTEELEFFAIVPEHP